MTATAASWAAALGISWPVLDLGTDDSESFEMISSTNSNGSVLGSSFWSPDFVLDTLSLCSDPTCCFPASISSLSRNCSNWSTTVESWSDENSRRSVEPLLTSMVTVDGAWGWNWEGSLCRWVEGRVGGIRRMAGDCLPPEPLGMVVDTPVLGMCFTVIKKA